MPNKKVTSEGTDQTTSDDVLDMDPKETVDEVSAKGSIDEQVDSLLNAPNTNPNSTEEDEDTNASGTQAEAGLEGEINVSEPTVDPEGDPVPPPVAAYTANPNAENVVMTVEGENGAENLLADYDNLNQVPTPFSNPPSVSPDDENAVTGNASSE